MKLQILAAAFGTLLMASVANAQLPLNGSGFIIPDNDSDGNSSSIVTAIAGNVPAGFGLGITFGGPPHTWAGDLIITLSHFNGIDTVTADIARRIGKTSTSTTDFGDSSDLNGLYQFSDLFTTAFWNPPTQNPGPTVVPGGYRATTNLFNGQPGAVVSLNSVFAGRTWAGTWTLKISDNAAGDVGAITGWTLGLVPAPGGLAMLGLAGLVGPHRRRQ